MTTFIEKLHYQENILRIIALSEFRFISKLVESVVTIAGGTDKHKQS